MYSNPTTSLPPGFRFHPTDEELILHYLRNRAATPPCPVSIIAEVDIYKFDPWELPAKATFGDREWYFFSPRDRKYPNGVRPNRAAGSGYWKATGTDKPIPAAGGGGEGAEESGSIGVKKALVFYVGRPPKGRKTDWIMHEYRLAEAGNANTYRPLKLRDHSMRLDEWVLCRIYKKSNNLPSSSVPPLMDDDYVSGAEDNVMTQTSQAASTAQEEAPTRVARSFSISEVFDDDYYYNKRQLFGAAQPELPVFDYASLMAPPFVGTNQLSVGCENTDDSCQIGKRQRIVGDGYASDPCFAPNLSSQFDSGQYGLLISQQQQLLLNSHLGLH